MVKVTLENITHIYDKKVKAVDNINLEIPHGKLTALLGPSGCGKTTTLRIIAGLIYPTLGKVYFNERDVTMLPPEKRNVAMVFQFPVVYSIMTIYENLAFPLRIKKLPKDQIDREVKRVAEFLGIQQYLHLKPIGLSADVKQKAALGRALIKQADILILDEPLTNIDPSARVELREKILQIKRETGITTVYVTHDQAEALTLADLIAVMREGKILQFASPEEIYNHPTNTFVAWFLGNPGMNLVKGILRRVNSKTYVELDSVQIHLPTAIWEEIAKRVSTNEIIFGIRPESVEVYTESRPGCIYTKIFTVEDTGALRIATVNLGDVEIKVKTEKFLKEGQEVYIKFPIEYVKIFDKDGNLIYG
jgi:ABC-type sugar transport system ATPase subunit